MSIITSQAKCCKYVKFLFMTMYAIILSTLHVQQLMIIDPIYLCIVFHLRIDGFVICELNIFSPTAVLWNLLPSDPG